MKSLVLVDRSGQAAALPEEAAHGLYRASPDAACHGPPTSHSLRCHKEAAGQPRSTALHGNDRRAAPANCGGMVTPAGKPVARRSHLPL